MYDLNDKEEILFLAENCAGKTFGEIDDKNILSEKRNKGALGHVIEMNVFQYDRNSKSEKDFLVAGLELKVTPYRINKNGTLSAKERLVLNMIDYYKDYDKTFLESSFWKKNQELLLMFYRYEANVARKKYMITHILDFSYPKNDLVIIRQDYEIIQKKIKNGMAHLISEGDTMYLGACTKGATSKDTRKQPFNTINAKQRAYSLKTTYMTQILRRHITNSNNEVLFVDDTLVETISFEENIRLRVRKYLGMSQKELKELFSIDNNPKNINEILFSRMLDIQGRVSNSDEFKKANIIPKTVRINQNGFIKESMSFPTFEFYEIYKHTWDDSLIKEYFETSKFLFIIFRFNSQNQLIFENIKLWNIPYEVINNYISDVYNNLRQTISEGNIVERIDKRGRRLTNFPGISFNGICHIRPHGTNGQDVYALPVADRKTGIEKFTKQCFWLNNTYIKSILQ